VVVAGRDVGEGMPSLRFLAERGRRDSEQGHRQHNSKSK
jgi:hypothetical protein